MLVIELLLMVMDLLFTMDGMEIELELNIETDIIQSKIFIKLIYCKTQEK